MPLRARMLRASAPLLAALLAVASCQWAGDKSAVRASFSVLKNQVVDVHGRITSAVQNGEAERIPALDRELNTVLDQAMKQSSAMNLLDREHLAISVATARRCLTEMDRFSQSGDMELLRAQAQQLEPTVTEIRELLERAERTTNAT